MISIQTAGARPGAAPAARDTQAAKPKGRLPRSKVAKPLLTSLATATLLGSACFATIATYTTGSLLPWRWSHADWSVATVRYQVCGRQAQGLGVFSCMLRAGIRPGSSAATTAADAFRQGAPQYSLQTVQDPAPAAQPAAPSGSTHSGSPRVGSTTGSESNPVVNPPANPPQPQRRPQPQPSPQSSPQPQPSPTDE